MFKQNKLRLSDSFDDSGTICWQSPSNIALIKYWGKYGQQLPKNPSLSFTLDNAHTITELSYQTRKDAGSNVSLDFRFEGKPNADFQLRIERFLNSMIEYFPFLPQLHLSIDSRNSFPHSAGIASSASAMSALALCLCSLEQELFQTLDKLNEFYQKASYIARLGSGSACRSTYEKIAVWGEFSDIKESSNEYAVPFYEKVNPVFHSYKDTILIASKDEKSVSSSAGHALMDENIFADTRFKQANLNLGDLLSAMEARDLEKFGTIVENEALTLHALMMTSSPPYILMQTSTLEMIQAIWQYRKESNLPVYFTLDAGPNIHLLYPSEIASKVDLFVSDRLAPLCEENMLIKDQVGDGPKKLVNAV